MARSNTANFSNYFSNGAAAVTGTPLTMSTFFNVANVTEDHVFMSLCNATTDAFFFLGALGLVGGDPVVASANNAGTEAFASSSVGFSANTLQHACGVWTSATSRTVYLNVGSSGTNTTNITPGGINRTYIGRLAGGGNLDYATFNGLMAEAGIWNVALTAAEVLQLSKGLSPLLVRPAALVAYWPLWGRQSPEPDLVGGLHLTMTGTVAQAAHPRVFMPRAPMIGKGTAASGDIAGTSSIAFTNSGAATGSGLLAGTTAAAFLPTGVIAGAGALSGVSASAFTPTAAITASGALIGTSPIVFAPSAVLLGAGVLTGASPVVLSVSGEIVNASAGAVTGTSALTFTPAGVLTGAGDVAGTSAAAFTTAGVAHGAGAIAGSSALLFSLSGSLTNLTAGSMTGTAALAFTPVGLPRGSGVLAGASSLTVTASATLNGLVFIAGTTQLTTTVAGVLRGSGQLAGQSSATLAAEAAVTGVGDLAGASAMTFEAEIQMGDFTPDVLRRVRVTVSNAIRVSGASGNITVH